MITAIYLHQRLSNKNRQYTYDGCMAVTAKQAIKHTATTHYSLNKIRQHSKEMDVGSSN